MENHYLLPSTLFASDQEACITTVLGSCVAVCLWDPVLRTGGMNHFMLPLWNGQGLPSPKYGNIAIDKLLERMKTMGSQPSMLHAKVFGGGEILVTQNDQFHIGKRNIELAKTQLRELGIQIKASSLGGTLGRKIKFNTHNGEVRQQYIQKSLV